MSDAETHADTTACSVCGLEVMASFVVELPPIAAGGGYATCPRHVDTVIARLQDNLHETMVQYEGVLTDWWEALHPPPEPLTVIDEEAS